jgi:hypothetical protein
VSSKLISISVDDPFREIYSRKQKLKSMRFETNLKCKAVCFHSCRCAVAHSYYRCIFSPDNRCQHMHPDFGLMSTCGTQPLLSTLVSFLFGPLKHKNFIGNIKMLLKIMAFIFPCKYSNALKLHKKFEGFKELHVQIHCVFSVFIY